MASDLSQSLDLNIYRYKDYILLISTADRNQINWHAHTSEGDLWTCTGVKQISQASCFLSTRFWHARWDTLEVRITAAVFLIAEKPPASPSSAGEPGSVKAKMLKLGLPEVDESNIIVTPRFSFGIKNH
uniref:Uncharacterized protein n=2 Tax=Oryza sativa subsp. japonica TaxID=39947 RepID=Q69J76_ORYSJ|nr:hypothetical protein [Oryza sativa Japonica Group]BAD30307.1 hypothetical protein [Oryza sativa Japonica Group]BAD31986.1 hypothetical protein [Oryza sativa Japonica Group]